MRRGDGTEDPDKKVDFYSRALEIVDLGQGNTNPEKQAPLYELETLVYGKLRNEEALKASIQVLAKKYNSSRGYYVYARFLLTQAEKAKGTDRRGFLDRALKTIDEALALFPGNEQCLQLKARILRALYPDDIKQYFSLLEQWATVASPTNISLLYELAVTAFTLGYYQTSYKRFSELERLSVGYRGRFIMRSHVLAESGQRRTYEGTVVRVESPEEGEIKVDTLRNLDRNVRFRPYTCNFTPHEGDLVTFTIGFNYVLPEADDVKKLN